MKCYIFSSRVIWTKEQILPSPMPRQTLGVRILDTEADTVRLLLNTLEVVVVPLLADPVVSAAGGAVVANTTAASVLSNGTTGSRARGSSRSGLGRSNQSGGLRGSAGSGRGGS